jgi:mannose-6-phosphate isomerase-like protein (cupin superfamily)
LDVAAFDYADLLAARERAGATPYHEFLRVPAMSAGIYRIPAGGTDRQSPHTEDELYYVVRGKARIRAGELDIPVHAGSIVFVAAEVEHRFYDIGEALEVMVFFAPAEYSRGAKGPGAGAAR